MKIKNRYTELEYEIQFQQYETGLYIVIYKDGKVFHQQGYSGSREEYLMVLQAGGFEIVEEEVEI